MRRISKRNILEKINKEIIFIASLFIVCVTIGSLLNKIFPDYMELVSDNITSTANFYNSNINLKDTIFSNLKMDLFFLGGISLATISVIFFPIGLILFAVKGISIGYTINSFILAMKFGSIKILLITLVKILIVLPGMLILSLISIKYLGQFIHESRRKNKANFQYIIKRYLINSSIIVSVTILAQTILNTISITILKIF
ncbi:stage II sporulation protein M [Paraclostridium sordellii]